MAVGATGFGTQPSGHALQNLRSEDAGADGQAQISEASFSTTRGRGMGLAPPCRLERQPLLGSGASEVGILRSESLGWLLPRDDRHVPYLQARRRSHEEGRINAGQLSNVRRRQVVPILLPELV